MMRRAADPKFSDSEAALVARVAGRLRARGAVAILGSTYGDASRYACGYAVLADGRVIDKPTARIGAVALALLDRCDALAPPHKDGVRSRIVYANIPPHLLP